MNFKCLNDQLSERFEVKANERFVNDLGLIFLAQLSCSQKDVSAGGTSCQQKTITCKFPSGLKTTLLKVLLCLQVFVMGVIERRSRTTMSSRDFSSLFVFIENYP